VVCYRSPTLSELPLLLNPTLRHRYILVGNMETEGLEFTVEDILQCHRGWITDLYINEEKTEVEIVELLHERRLFVTCGFSTVSDCLR